MARPFTDPVPFRPNLRIQLVPGVWYRAACKSCGWRGQQHALRDDAEADVERHATRCKHLHDAG